MQECHINVEPNISLNTSLFMKYMQFQVSKCPTRVDLQLQ